MKTVESRETTVCQKCEPLNVRLVSQDATLS